MLIVELCLVKNVKTPDNIIAAIDSYTEQNFNSSSNNNCNTQMNNNNQNNDSGHVSTNNSDNEMEAEEFKRAR